MLAPLTLLTEDIMSDPTTEPLDIDILESDDDQELDQSALDEIAAGGGSYQAEPDMDGV